MHDVDSLRTLTERGTEAENSTEESLFHEQGFYPR